MNVCVDFVGGDVQWSGTEENGPSGGSGWDRFLPPRAEHRHHGDITGDTDTDTRIKGDA